MMKLSRSLSHVSLALAIATLAGCSSAPRSSGGNGTGGSEEEGGTGGSTSTGGKAGSTGGSSGSTGGSSGSTGGSSGSTGGSSGSTGGAGGSTGGASGSTGGAGGGMGGAAGGAPGTVAGELHGAYLELTCSTMRVTAQFCQPKDGQANLSIPIKFGGEAGKMYDVVLEVWGIVEMQTYTGGMTLGTNMYVGGSETMVGNANYSVYSLIVGETQYRLNRFGSAGGDKVVPMHYKSPPIKIPGGSMLTLRHFDKNNHMTRNFSKLSVEMPSPGLLEKIKMQPFDGAFLYIEVVSATPSM